MLKFDKRKSGLQLARRTQPGIFYDVVGRRAAAYGYEHQGMEAWVHPLKILDDFQLAFQLVDYPSPFRGVDLRTHIDVRPEATTFTYSHAAFTVRETIFAPIDEPGIIILLAGDSVLPLSVRVSFRPRLRLAWPAGLPTNDVSWDDSVKLYFLTEESGRFVGVIGSPLADQVSLQPYQEEPRDAPLEFSIAITPQLMKTNLIPIVIAASIDDRLIPTSQPHIAQTNVEQPSAEQPSAEQVGVESPSALHAAKAVYERLLASARTLYEQNVRYYERLQQETTSIKTPCETFDQAFAWAKVGVDKGFATNPLLGTGLVAGFRTSGDSERAGFAWFFGRDALWTSFALIAVGDFAGTRTALNFLNKFQRSDGKLPHEISQSAALLPWFTDYPYPWASADAMPLYCIAHAELFDATGDQEYLADNWESIKRAYLFTRATDTDGNDLVENTNFGHGWVEGGALYPPHEEIYLQGLWIEASKRIAKLARVMNDNQLAIDSEVQAERTRAAVEAVYWLPDCEFYAFATTTAAAWRLSNKTLIEENTILPAVPLWWHELDGARAQKAIDNFGSSALQTDWGARLLSNKSELYDPLSYHYGSVWPLFTGWASIAAYAYGRPHIGFALLMANVRLTFSGALGYVTELLSGDFNRAFGRSSHHQVWSEAMVVAPTVRALLGLEVSDGGRTLRFAPQLPADWNHVSVRRVSAGQALIDLELERRPGKLIIDVVCRPSTSELGAPIRVVIAPSFPLDARVQSISVNNRSTEFEIITEGDVQRVRVNVEDALTSAQAQIVFTYTEGTDVYQSFPPLVVGERNQGLRIISAPAEEDTLRLVLEGRGGNDDDGGGGRRTYRLNVRSPHRIDWPKEPSSDLEIKDGARDDEQQLLISFDRTCDEYVRRQFVLPLIRGVQ